MRIVLADDSLKIRQIIRSMLINLGHEVVAEGVNGTEAIAFCARYLPDIAILDMSMGVVGGDVAALRIREEQTAGKILLFTSRASIKEEWESKGYPVLIKPIMEGNLKNKISEVVNGSS
jgi:two-component system chemotaxis response regulator CheY